jgi:hypothetical protein
MMDGYVMSTSMVMGGWIQFSLVCKHHTSNHVREHTTHELLDSFFVTMIASL